MKKILLLLATSILLHGCYVTDVNETPMRTRTAHWNFLSIQNAIASTNSCAHMALCANNWLKAETEQERNQIEERHFNLFKLTVKNDTLRLFNLLSETTYNIITNGTTLNDPSASWQIITAGDTLLMQKSAENQWSLTAQSESFLMHKPNLKVSQQPSEAPKYDQLLISGKGAAIEQYYSNEIFDYTIKEDLSIAFPIETGKTPCECQWTMGELSFYTQSKPNDEAIIKVEDSSFYWATYKGYTERWSWDLFCYHY